MVSNVARQSALRLSFDINKINTVFRRLRQYCLFHVDYDLLTVINIVSERFCCPLSACWDGVLMCPQFVLTVSRELCYLLGVNMRGLGACCLHYLLRICFIPSVFTGIGSSRVSRRSCTRRRCRCFGNYEEVCLSSVCFPRSLLDNL